MRVFGVTAAKHRVHIDAQILLRHDHRHGAVGQGGDLVDEKGVLAEQHFVARAQIGIGQHGQQCIRAVAAARCAPDPDHKSRRWPRAGCARCLRDRGQAICAAAVKAPAPWGSVPARDSLEDSLNTSWRPAHARARRHRARCQECRAWAWAAAAQSWLSGSEFRGRIDKGRARQKQNSNRRFVDRGALRALANALRWVRKRVESMAEAANPQFLRPVAAPEPIRARPSALAQTSR